MLGLCRKTEDPEGADSSNSGRGPETGCVLVVLTQGESESDFFKALSMAHDFARPRGGEVRVLQIVEVLSKLPIDRVGIGAVQKLEVPELRGVRFTYEFFPTRKACDCVESHAERLSPSAVVVVRDTFRWKGVLQKTTEYIGHRFGIPVVVIHPEDAGRRGFPEARRNA